MMELSISVLGSEKYMSIVNRNKYVIRLKRDISYIFPHNYTKVEIDLDDNLPLENTLNMYIVIIKKLGFNKKNYRYYY